MRILTEYFLWFVIYSVSGWGYESAVCSVTERKPVNRGFLNGPLCPVYGFGALISIVCLYGRTDNVLLLFTSGMVLACTVEYITSVLLEKLFDMKWWDYSEYRFNLNGRISLLGAVVFGTLSAVLIKWVHPFVAQMTGYLSPAGRAAVSAAIFVAISADLLITVRHLLSLNGRLREIQTAIAQYKAQQLGRVEDLKQLIMDKFEESEFYSERIKSLIRLDKIQNTRLAKAFPRRRSIKYEDAWQKIKNTLSRR